MELLVAAVDTVLATKATAALVENILGQQEAEKVRMGALAVAATKDSSKRKVGYFFYAIFL
jgi:hypothetical protein